MLRTILNFIFHNFLILIFCLSFTSVLHAQPYDYDSLISHNPEFKAYIESIQDTFDIFNDEEVLQVTLKSDFKNLVKRKYHDDYQPAELQAILFDSVVLRWDITIRPRGEFRRDYCFYPPIKLNFNKKEAIFKQFSAFDKVKFVGNCKSGDMYDDYLLQEYYIYKMFNQLTPYSFRARLMKVTYIDTSGKKKPRESYAFIIESIDQLAARLNGINFEREKISPQLVDRESGTLMDIFQFMIGNTDYAVPIFHNVKLIKVADPEHPNLIVIPYDFDYSGIINAFYAIPGEHLPIENVRQRYFMGYCREPEEYEEVFGFFREKRKEIEDVIIDSEYLSERAKKAPLDYIDEFYGIIDNQGAVKSLILNNCK